MKCLKLYIIFILFYGAVETINAQNELLEYYLLKTSVNNRQTMSLADGFYPVKTVYRETRYKSERKRYVDTTQTYTGFGFFKKEVKTYHVYSENKVEPDTAFYPFDRLHTNTKRYYNVDPYPVALRKNILRVYESEVNEYDSILTEGLTFKLNHWQDSLLCKKTSNRDCFEIGLIINNQLVEITQIELYGKTRAPGNQKNYHYITFFFRHKTQEEIDALKEKLLINSLIQK